MPIMPDKNRMSRIDWKLIAANKQAHDRLAQTYDALHGEIFNPTEQNRLRNSIDQAIGQVRTGSRVLHVLDFGAGTGNLTRHFLDLQSSVVAADVSAGSLEQLKLKLRSSDRLQTMVLNGKDLSNIGENNFDMVATYSVLHHIPDYLKIVDEFIRVVKPGGIIHIDHEASPSYWEENEPYMSYLEELGEPFRQAHLLELDIRDKKKGYGAHLMTRLKKVLSRGKMTGSLLRKFDLIHDEGDIHTTKNDHIEWEDIKTRCLPSCELLLEKDYLVCREADDPAPVWMKWRNKTVDMRIIVARKLNGPPLLRP